MWLELSEREVVILHDAVAESMNQAAAQINTITEGRGGVSLTPFERSTVTDNLGLLVSTSDLQLKLIQLFPEGELKAQKRGFAEYMLQFAKHKSERLKTTEVKG